MSNNNSVAIAMSGGVDSAAAAMILKDQGWNCVGVFMRNWDNADESAKDKCPIDKDRDHMLEASLVFIIRLLCFITSNLIFSRFVTDWEFLALKFNLLKNIGLKFSLHF